MIDFDATVLAACEAAFGETVTWFAGDGTSLEVQGIFNERFSTTAYQQGEEVRSTHPMVSIRASQVPRQPHQAELFRIRGILYQVSETDPDGLGDLRVHLRVASDDQAHRQPLPPS